jgi:hypothetical protein
VRGVGIHLGDGEPVEFGDRGVLFLRPRRQRLELDSGPLAEAQSGERPPEFGLPGDPDRQALELEDAAERGVAAQVTVRLEAREPLEQPGENGLDRIAGDAEAVDDALEVLRSTSIAELIRRRVGASA